MATPPEHDSKRPATVRLYKRVAYVFVESGSSVEFSYIPRDGNDAAIEALRQWAEQVTDRQIEETLFGDDWLTEAEVDVLCARGALPDAQIPVLHKKLSGRLDPAAWSNLAVAGAEPPSPDGDDADDEQDHHLGSSVLSVHAIDRLMTPWP